MATEKASFKVSIFGEEYPLKGEGDPDYVARIAEYVDKKMKESAEKYRTFPLHKVAVLASMNIAGELFQVGEMTEKLVSTLEKVSNRAGPLQGGNSGKQSEESADTR
ncbi:MAG: cell division protein ZapA [Candidatus Eisenbacteria bacterium]|nr:cell division protein ZapA [Candidatus Eisenbacteria bacterium]